MPFTIAHVAAVLPFSRFLKPRHLLSAAVVVSYALGTGFTRAARDAGLPTIIVRFDKYPFRYRFGIPLAAVFA